MSLVEYKNIDKNELIKCGLSINKKSCLKYLDRTNYHKELIDVFFYFLKNFWRRREIIIFGGNFISILRHYPSYCIGMMDWDDDIDCVIRKFEDYIFLLNNIKKINYIFFKNKIRAKIVDLIGKVSILLTDYLTETGIEFFGMTMNHNTNKIQLCTPIIKINNYHYPTFIYKDGLGESFCFDEHEFTFVSIYKSNIRNFLGRNKEDIKLYNIKVPSLKQASLWINKEYGILQKDFPTFKREIFVNSQFGTSAHYLQQYFCGPYFLIFSRIVLGIYFVNTILTFWSFIIYIPGKLISVILKYTKFINYIN